MTATQRGFIFAIVFFLLLILLKLLQPILTPFLLAALLAYLGDPFVSWMASKGVARAVTVCFIFLILGLLTVVSLLLLLPKLAQQMDRIINYFPQIMLWLQQVVMPWLSHYISLPTQSAMLEQLNSTLAVHWEKLSHFAVTLLQQLSQSTLMLVTWFVNLLIIPVVTFYLLLDWRRLLHWLHDVVPRDWEGTIVKLARASHLVLSAFVRGQLLVMLGLGVFYSLALWLVGLEIALVVGMLAGIASVVPYMGLVLGLSTSLVVAWFQFHDWLPLLMVGGVFMLGQCVEGMLLVPLLIGDKIGLHPVAVVFAVLAGGQLFGFVGVLLALPVAAVIMVVLHHIHQAYKESTLYQTRTD